MATKDYYLILGVSRTESESGIREAFRELAKRYHPDRVGPQSTRFFQDILEAYQLLSDPERRKHYNQGLHHAEGRMEVQPEPIIVGQWPRPEPLVPEPLSALRGFQTIHPSFEALFERFRRNFTGLGVPKGERSCQEQGMIEEEETVRVQIPPLVRDGTILEVPIRGLGIHNFYLRLHIRIAA